MMAKRINVTAVMAVSLFFLFGCGQPPMMMDADSGPDIMDDGGVDADSGVPPNPNDGGMPDADGGGGESCTPTEDDPTCSGQPDATCVCDTSDLTEGCAINPIICERTEDARNYCVPGRNRCGDDMPMSMSSYDPQDFKSPVDCSAFINFDFWFGPAGETVVRSFMRNGQLIVQLGSYEYTCSHNGRCYDNWAYEDDPEVAPYGGDHGSFVMSSDCRGITVDRYYGWNGQTEPDEIYGYVFRRDA